VARQELAAEVQYYAAISPALGAKFLASIEQAVRLAAEFPEAGAPHRFDTRCVYPKRFPFFIVYRANGAGIIVIAIAPFRRKPDYWAGRA
jgi:toxin ParE1/3/4